MTSRDRWTIYPLLFLAIGLGLNANIQGQADHSAFEGNLVRGKKLDGDVVLCKELVVINDDGKPVVQIAANKTGGGILQARNGTGTVQTVLSADPPGFESEVLRGKKLDGDVVICKELIVLNDDGKPVVEMTANQKSGAGVWQARNGTGTVQAVLSADPPGGVLRMLDVNGKYFQFPSIELRPLPAQSNKDANSNEEQPAAKDSKAEK
jgi:antitoxin (DNA-binding transcriptional repressor) of toxin-antitoxin stability system